MQAIEITRMNADDYEFLRRMLVAAAYWRESTIPQNTDKALSRPDLSFLLENWGHSNDRAIVARAGSTKIGAAWFRTCVRSYGYVDDETPELGIGVDIGMRGLGVGTKLLTSLIEVARQDGRERLSLSVELDNPARKLYQRLGFCDYRVEEIAATMTIDTSREP